MWETAVGFLLIVLIVMTVVSTVAAAVMAALYLRCRRASGDGGRDAALSETSIRLEGVQRRLQGLQDELYELRHPR